MLKKFSYTFTYKVDLLITAMNNRLFGGNWIQYHPTIGWHLVANKTVILSHRGKIWVLNTDQFGARMGYSGGRGGQKPSKTYLMYGDSFSLGGKVNDSQTFAYIVEHKQKIRIVNFSVPGFGTDQQRLLYQETSMWIDADGYIFSISIESIIRNIQRYRPSWKGREAYGLYFRAKPYYLITNDHLVLQGVPVPGNRFRRNELVKTDYPLFNTSCAYKDDRYSAWTLMKMILSELIAEIPKQKKIVLLLLPDEDYYINNVTAHYRSRFTEFASNYQNVIIIDALDSFLGYRTSERKKLFFPYDHHYTPLGHRVIASFLKAIL